MLVGWQKTAVHSHFLLSNDENEKTKQKWVQQPSVSVEQQSLFAQQEERQPANTSKKYAESPEWKLYRYNHDPPKSLIAEGIGHEFR